jgi:hypothetical protein
LELGFRSVEGTKERRRRKVRPAAKG